MMGIMNKNDGENSQSVIQFPDSFTVNIFEISELTKKVLINSTDGVDVNKIYVEPGRLGNDDIEIRDMVKKGEITLAPDMQVSGNSICMTGGHGWSMIGCEADGVDGCTRAARLQLRKGVDWIKVMATGGVMTRGVEPGSPQLNVAEMRAIVEEAHKAGVKTCTHAQGRQGIKNALMAGIDCIEHGCFLDDESIEMMKRNGTWFVPTLCAPYFINKYAMGSGIPDFVIRKNNLVNDAHKKSFKRAFDEGISIACGTDAGTPYNGHDNSPMEPVLMVENGISPIEAMKIATIKSAQLCGVENELGSISVGKKAHFAVFNENPMENIKAVLECQMTIKNGEVIYRK